MSRFAGGFASATALLGAAMVAGRPWPALATGACVLMLLGWLASRRLRNRGYPPLPGRDPGQQEVFAARGTTARWHEEAPRRGRPDRR